MRTRPLGAAGHQRRHRLPALRHQADPGETRNLADLYPSKVRELYGIVLRRAGGRLPYYPG